MTAAAIIMWLMVSPYSGFTSENLKDGLYETRSDCIHMATYLSTHGFPGQRCIPLRVEVVK